METRPSGFLFLSNLRCVYVAEGLCLPSGMEKHQLKAGTGGLDRVDILGGFFWNLIDPPKFNELPMKITIFPARYHQNGGFSMAMLVYRSVDAFFP